MKIPELPPVSGSREAKSPHGDLHLLNPDELLDLRAKVDALLPIRSLRQLNLEQELVFQLQTVQRLQLDVFRDQDTPANQRAQVAGQVANTLSALGKMQIEVYDSERLKQIEAILIETLNDLPQGSQKAFLAAYEEKLGAISA